MLLRHVITPMKTYPLAPAQIGNSSGFRLSAEFYREYPQFKDAKGRVEVVAENVLLVILEPQEVQVEEENSLMLKLFLDFLMEDALKNPQSLEVYTQEMSDEEDELLVGVVLD